MKNILTTLVLGGMGSFGLFAQERDLPGTERAAAPENLGSAANVEDGKASGDLVAAPGSDSGAQRPLRMKKTGASTYFGYQSKYFYRSNPTMSPGELSQLRTAMWTNTFYAGLGLGAHDIGDSVITPYFGASWTINDFLGDLDNLNYNTTGAYGMLMAQYANGWSSRLGVNYFSDVETESDQQTYAEYNPNIGLMKVHGLGGGTLAIFDLSAGYHSTDSESVVTATGTGTKITDALDAWEIAAKLGLNKRFGSVRATPAYRVSYKKYSNGDNDGRSDVTQNIGVDFDWSIAKGVSINLGTNYSNRSSSGGYANKFDFKNLDGGGGLSINARF
tara:strand:- start:187 stop:1182 length:996 start_codon:yes stop_codon:yes gene_type:complete